MLKKLLAIVAGGMLSTALTLSQANACPPAKDDPAKAETTKKAPVKKAASASFRVTGMHCGGCADKVKAALGKTEGVVSVDVNVADKRVKVDFDADKISAEKIGKMISDLGYPATTEA